MGPAEVHLRNLAIQSSKNFCATRGNVSAPLCLIGEAPGVDEDREGKPFVGSSGKELDRMAHDAGINTSSGCWMTNTFFLRPPDNDEARIEELGIAKQTHEDCLLEQLYEHKPVIICTLGATPTAFLCPHTLDRRDNETKITKWRGSLLQSPKLTWPHYVVPVQHPAHILREWSDRQVAVLCLAKAKEELDYFVSYGKLQALPSRQLLTGASPHDTIDYLREVLLQKGPTSWDIELTGRRVKNKTHYIAPDMMAFTKSPWDAMSFMLFEYDEVSLVKIWRLVDQILRTKPIIGQNALSFDWHWAMELGFRPQRQNFNDTLIAHHVLWVELEHKLQFTAMQYTREPYFKDEGKLWSAKENPSSKARYNAKDAAITHEVWLAIEKELHERKLWDFYEYEIQRNRALLSAELRGYATDPAKILALHKSVISDIETKCKEAEALVGKPVASCKKGDSSELTVKKVAVGANCKVGEVVNIASSKQLIEVLQARGIKVPIKRGRGTPTVDETALLKIAIDHPQDKLPTLVLDIRELNKIKGTNIDANLHNNILFSSYNAAGTITGRLSSAENVFGFGTNLQNIPKHSDLGLRLRECYVARPGCIILEADQKGAEDWVVQALIVDNGGSDVGLEELRAGINRHKRLAAYLFAKPESDIDKAGMYYYAGKKTRHAGNYGMEAFRMSEVMLVETGIQMLVSHTTFLLQKFHEFEPDIKGVFHKYVEDTIRKTRTLVTPFGRERYFSGLRPNSSNYDVIKSAYAQIPQSTVGDNTGMAFVEIERRGFAVLSDDHDAIKIEVLDDPEHISEGFAALKAAFNRTIIFPHGTKINIPLEFMMGYNLGNLKECHDITRIGSQNTRQQLLDMLRPQSSTTIGQPQHA
jgi:uracil-DNA glycosylase family 4